MPSQQEGKHFLLTLVEYYRKRHHRMNRERFLAANFMALVSHTLTQPMDLVKMRQIMLQEGKLFQGIAHNKGYSPFRIFHEIHEAGGGIRKMFCNIHTFVLRTLAYTTARTSCFLYFYDKMVNDPRRNGRPDFYVYAHLLGGIVAGVLTNPFEMIYTRMQADQMYPEQARWNYKNFVEAFERIGHEGALMRGSIANGLRIGALCSVMTGVHDYTKQFMYYYFGPIMLNRFLATSLAVGCGVALSQPFDTIRTRMHIMRPLPNGELPYINSIDCANKIIEYESNLYKMGNLTSFYAGSMTAYARLFLIAYICQNIYDAYYKMIITDELWHEVTYYHNRNIAIVSQEPWSKTGETMVDNALPMPSYSDPRVLRIPRPAIMF